MAERQASKQCPQCGRDIPIYNDHCYSCGYDYPPDEGPASITEPLPKVPPSQVRDYVRPFVIGLIGVAASVLFASIVTEILGPCEGAECTVQGLVNLLVYFPLLLVPGLLITGFLAARWSPDAWLALRAVVIAVLINWLAGGALITVARGTLDATWIVFLGIFVVWGALPLLVGFGIARLVRRR